MKSYLPEVPVMHKRWLGQALFSRKAALVAIAIWVVLLLLNGTGSFSYFQLRLSQAEVRSPNGQLRLSLQVTSRGEPFFTIDHANVIVIEPSKLGLAGSPDKSESSPHDMYDNMVFTSSSRDQVDHSWTPAWGERAAIPDHHNELSVFMQHRGTLRIVQFQVRAYNEGIAFRYILHGAPGQVQAVGRELTEFNVPSGSMAYWTPRAQAFYKRIPIAPEWASDCELPLTIELANGRWVSVAEAGQTNFTRMRMRAVGHNRLQTALFDKVVDNQPFATPWRVVLVGDTAGQLLEHNYVISNLNPPSEIPDTSWIHPGRVMREVTLRTDGAMALIDFAVKQNIDYIHFDAGWYGTEYDPASDATKVNSTNGNLDLQKVIEYAKANGRRIILYVNHLALEQQLDVLFPLYKSWHVDGVKFGFVNVGSRRWTLWLHEAIKSAASYQLVVDVHDDYRPTGFSRTYPNLLNVEGIAGDEEFPSAYQSTIYPFTRFIAGPADHTYCFFDKRLIKSKAHQLALTVINFGPLQYLSWYDSPWSYAKKDALDEIEFWKDLPTVWDDTKVVAGMPGEYVAVARRKGDDWWLGVITNEEPRVLNLSCSFLPLGQKFNARVFEDTESASISVRVVGVGGDSKVSLSMRASGGVALRLMAGM